MQPDFADPLAYLKGETGKLGKGPRTARPPEKEGHVTQGGGSNDAALPPPPPSANRAVGNVAIKKLQHKTRSGLTGRFTGRITGRFPVWGRGASAPVASV